MLAQQDGLSSSRKGRRDRAILFPKDRRPPENSQRGSIECQQHSETGSDLQRFEAALWQARNLWSIEQHRNGLADGRRLSRDAADRALRAGLAALEGNSLAKYRRGGGE
ncbi:hypothetical protein [Alteraurantiacibacter buctensis]|uniref:Uncharacterized protein n=1 Tax=Alteraurantiacibacter buctensis TaxID=1503981 RepID=A0A844YYY6_9SPHN|nr:hypothetical protein [Alteraurantiacibacter buctensis]MXO72382.1 hypothetical protein [Alteraurantiacibacter buctensis]